MNKIFNILSHWFRFRLYYYFKIFRPKNLLIEGKLDFDWKSFVAFSDANQIILCDSIKLKNSRIYINRSTVNIGAEASLQNSICIFENSVISIGNHATFYKSILHCRANSNFTCGDYFNLNGNYSDKNGFFSYNSKIEIGLNFNFFAHAQFKQSNFIAGNHISINQGTQVRVHQSLTIGNYVLVSYDCLIFDTNTHSTDYLVRREEFDLGFPNTTVQNEINAHKIVCLPITIGDDVWIGTRAIIFKGTEIGNQVVVGANAVVTGIKVPDGKKVFGNPAIIK